MGVVYRARQVALNRSVAVKMTLNDRGGERELIRFLAEAEAVALVNHPNVVQVYDYGESGGRMFMVLELCPGGSLADRLKNQGSLDPRAAAELVRKLAAGVAAAHQQGIVHRDLKPGNILFDAAGEPKVADFGLAKRAASEITQTGAIMGTPAYMAPEQAGGRTKFVGPSADVWALGVILYQCLTGCRPFDGETTDAVLSRVLLDEPSPIRDSRPGLPRDLEDICLHCLEKDPSRRYPTAVELSEDLARFLEGEPISAVRSGLVGRFAQSLERVRLQEQFSAHGSLLLALAPVMLLPELLISLVVWKNLSVAELTIANMGRATAFLLVVGWFRKWRFVPQGTYERQLWSIWGGYFLACYGMGVSNFTAHGPPEGAKFGETYLPLANLTALAFFAMAPTIWGYCAAIGIGFWLLSFVMAFDTRWAPLLFGVAWAGVLVLIGSRLRKLGRAVSGADSVQG
jgi:tRNA A-37 threonylcarbamoyl transferase component Bud32